MLLESLFDDTDMDVQFTLFAKIFFTVWLISIFLFITLVMKFNVLILPPLACIAFLFIYGFFKLLGLIWGFDLHFFIREKSRKQTIISRRGK